ncbi:autotransporter-associated beta strand repeat-containing protein [Phragmitibacter flavus]|nr:autotransporter-associated beta strand repeat-containing protein [Phragmitibacter flavus]
MKTPDRSLPWRKLSLVAGISMSAVLAINPAVAQSTWVDSSGDHLWSNFLNWSTDESPAGTAVTFDATGLAPSGTVTSIVDQNFSVTNLTFNYNSPTNWHTLQIDPSTTLTTTGAMVMTTASAGVARLAITGDGSWVVDSGVATKNNFTLTNAGGSNATASILDMSGLANFTANVVNFNVGTGSGAPVYHLNLAKTTNITATNMRFGGSTGTGTLTGSQVNFGQTTNLNATHIMLGTGRTSINAAFQSGLTGTPTVTIRGLAGGVTRANLVLGANTPTSQYAAVQDGSSSPHGVVDFSAGSVDFLLQDFVLGLSGISDPNNGIGYGKGTFTFDQGTIDAVNVVLGRVLNIDTSPLNSPGGQANALHAQFNMNGGTLLANNISLAQNEDQAVGVNANSKAEFNMTAGTATVAGDIVMGSHSAINPSAGFSDAKMTVTGGVMTVGGNITEGVGGNNLSSLTLGGTATLDMTGGYINVDTFNANSGTLKNVAEIYDGEMVVANLTKGGTGTLILEGNNTYSGNTVVQNGILQVGRAGEVGNLGSGDVQLQLATSRLVFEQDGASIVTQNISGLGGITQSGGGRTILNGNNTYTGSTIVSSGILAVEDAAALGGTSGVEVESGASFRYLGSGALGLTQGITLADGSAVGMTLDGHVSTSAAVAASGNIQLQLQQLAGQTFAGGTKTLLAAGSGLNSATNYELLLFNVTNYSVDDFNRTDTAVTVTITEEATAPLMVWQGEKVDGYEQVWAVSDGETSNWGIYLGEDTEPGSTPLVPGMDSDVLVTRFFTDELGNLEMSLGADMAMNSVWFRGNEINDGLPPAEISLVDKNFSLTLGKSTYQDDIEAFNYSLQANSTGKVLLDINQVIFSDPDSVILTTETTDHLEIRAVVDGNGFTKIGTGLLTLSGTLANTYSGPVNVNEGVLALGKTDGQNAITGDLNINAGGDVNNPTQVRLLANEQIADTADVFVESGALLVLNGFNESIDELSGTGRVRNGVTGTATLTVGAGNGSSAFDGIIENGGASPILLALTKAGTGTFTLNSVNTYGGLTTVLDGTLRYGVNNAIAGGGVTVDGGIFDLNGFRDTVGTTTLDNGGQIIGDGSVMISGSTRQFRDGSVSVSLAGNGGISKTTDGTVVLSGDNRFRGGVSHSGGILRLESDTALGTLTGTTTINGGSNAGRVELTGGITISERLLIGARQGTGSVDAAALSNLSGNNTWAGNIEFTTGGSSYNFESQAGLFNITGNLTGRSETTNGRQLQFFGAGDGIVSGVIANGPGTNATYAFRKKGTGTWTLAAANTFTGLTQVQEGTLRLTNGLALQNSSAVDVSTGANFIYQSGMDQDLTVASLSLAGNHRLGVEMGNAIASTGVASTIVGGNIVLDVYGVSGMSYTTGTEYNVITGGAGSSLDNANYSLGNFYNFTNFTLNSAVGKEAGRVFLTVTEAAVIPDDFYWKGGFTGAPNEWAVSNGMTVGGMSNWTTDEQGLVNTALVPGADANVIFSASNSDFEDAPMVLGASMNIGTLTFRTPNTVNVEDYVNTLTLNGSSAITVQTGSGLVSLNTNLIFANAAGVINVAAGEELGIGAVGGSNGFTKTGDGTLRFLQGGSSSHTGLVKLEAGTSLFNRGYGANSVSGDLEIGTAGGSAATARLIDGEQIADTSDVLINSGGVLDLNGQLETIAGLTGSGVVTSSGTGDAELTVGAGNATAVFNGTITEGVGGLFSLIKVGSGTQTFNQALSYSGTTEVIGGELRLASGGSIGVASSTAGNLRVGVVSGSTPAAPAKLVVDAGAELRVGNGAESLFEVGRGGLNVELAGTGGVGEVDLSASSNFTANVGRFLIGVENDGEAAGPSTGVVRLAQNNNITAATEVIVGDSMNSGNGGTSSLAFGSGINNVTTPLLVIGGRKLSANATIEAGGTLILESGATNPTGFTDLRVGYNNSGTASNPTAIMDMRGGTLVAELEELSVGYKINGGTGSANGSLYLGTSAGNNVSAITVTIGRLDGAATTDTKGLMSMEGGNVSVAGNVLLGQLGGASGTVEGRLEIAGGTFTVAGAGDITTTNNERSTSIVEVDGGTLNMGLGNINVDQLIARSGALANVGGIYNGSGVSVANQMTLTKTSAGILRLEGSNSYSGATQVNEGTLLVIGNNSLGGNFRVESGAVLGGSGTISPLAGNSVVIATGGALSIGDNALEAAHLDINTSGAGALVFENNSFLMFDLFGPGGQGDIIEDSYSDQLDITGTLTVGEMVQLSVSSSDIGGWEIGDTWQLINWENLGQADGRGNDFLFIDGANVASEGLSWDLSDLYVGGTITLAVIPEPTRAILWLFGTVAMLMRRRRRIEC